MQEILVTLTFLVSRPTISTVTFASVAPVTFLSSLSMGMTYVSLKEVVKSVRSMEARLILLMPASSFESPARLTVSGSMVTLVFSAVAPPPSMRLTPRLMSLTVSSGRVAVTTSVEKVMPAVEAGMLSAVMRV